MAQCELSSRSFASPGGRLRTQNRTFPENRLLDSIPAPGPHFNRIGCLCLASSPQSAKFKSVLQARMTQRELIAFARASASVRRNKKNAGSRHRRKGGSSCSTKPRTKKYLIFSTRSTGDYGDTQFVIVIHRECGTLGQRWPASRERRVSASMAYSELARPKRFELLTPRFVVWAGPLKSLKSVTVRNGLNRSICRIVGTSRFGLLP